MCLRQHSLRMLHLMRGWHCTEAKPRCFYSILDPFFQILVVMGRIGFLFLVQFGVMQPKIKLSPPTHSSSLVSSEVFGYDRLRS